MLYSLLGLNETTTPTETITAESTIDIFSSEKVIHSSKELNGFLKTKFLTA